MSLIHITAVRNEIVDLVVDKLDEGTTNTYGRLVFKTSGGDVLSTHDLSDPAFAAAASGAAVANAIANATASASGTVAKFELQDKDETKIVEGTVTAVGGGGDLEAAGTSLAITSGDTVEVSALTYNGPT